MFRYVIGFVVVVDVRSVIPSRSQVMEQYEGEYSELGVMASPLDFGWPLLLFPFGWSSGSMKS